MYTATSIGDAFRAIFDQEAAVLVQSPGRINIIGEHTDYNGGFVLPTAIDKKAYVAMAPRADSVIRLYAEDFQAFYEGDVNALAATAQGWPNYILGVVDGLAAAGHRGTGFNLYLAGEVPLGAGLSSSAAVSCAVGFALNTVFSYGLDRVALAKVAQHAEHVYAGVHCGLMDQFASLLSLAGQVIQLDCASLRYRHVPLTLGSYRFLLLNSNVKHSLASTAYNERRRSCEQGVAWLQAIYPEVRTLRGATLSMLEEHVRPRDADVYRKCAFVLAENARVEQACVALEQGDLSALGQLMYGSHAGLSEDYAVSCAELDFLVEQVRGEEGVLGARMMGGGFGGCTINLIHEDAVEALLEKLVPAYQEKFNLSLIPIQVYPSNGTELLT